MKAKVTVYPRPEILDPQGQAIKDALGRIGFGQVESVRAGKSFEIEIDTAGEKEAEALLHEMCEKLLANPVVEDFSYEMLDAEGGEA